MKTTTLPNGRYCGPIRFSESTSVDDNRRTGVPVGLCAFRRAVESANRGIRLIFFGSLGKYEH
jgi:hypothetical protein